VEPTALSPPERVAPGAPLLRLLAWIVTPAGVVVSVGVIAFAAALAHVLVVVGYHGPWVFDDELGYERLAHSLGTSGTLALFGKQGLSYSPLYSLVIAPLYAFHLSSVAAYEGAKIENAVLMALAVVPIYRIARFALPRGYALAATALSALAPLMLYSTLEMSENLAYPLFLFMIWALLVSIRSPGWGHDAIVIALFVLCVATRLQFIALLPAALVAVVLAGLATPTAESARRRTLRALTEHALLTAATAGLALLVVTAWLGTSVLSLAGRYANQQKLPFPSPWLVMKLFVEHVAGLDFAVGFIPFAGAVLAAILWGRRRSGSEVTAFAAVSLSVTFFVVLVTAVASYGQSYVGGHIHTGNAIPRIHERYMFYLVPLFVVALLATTRLARSESLLRLGVFAAVVAGLLPVVIPFSLVINPTIGVDTFSFAPFAASSATGAVEAHHHAVVLAVGLALGFSLIYALARPNAVLIVAVVAAMFVWVSSVAFGLLDVGAHFAMKSAVPAQHNWVDAKHPDGDVVLIENARATPRSGLADLESAFYNFSISSLYYPCKNMLSSDFGETKVSVGSDGRVVGPSGPLNATYVVAPMNAGVEGRVVAVDRPGKLVLVQPSRGVVRVSPGARAGWDCASPKS
jgi:hypothetical protein